MWGSTLAGPHGIRCKAPMAQLLRGPREQCSNWRWERGSGSFGFIDALGAGGLRKPAGERVSHQLTGTPGEVPSCLSSAPL